MWSAITRNRRLGMLAVAETRAALGSGGVVPAVERYASEGPPHLLDYLF